MIKTYSFGFAMLSLMAMPALAEQSTEQGAEQSSVDQFTPDSNIKPVGCDDCCDSCCDDCCDGCDGGCCSCGGSSCGGGGAGAAGGMSLAALMGLEGSAWDIGGWTQFGYHDNQTPRSTSRGDLAAFNDVPDNLNLQQQWFYAGKEADGSRGLDWGFRFDAVYGTDAQKTQAFGNPGGEWDVPWDHGVYGWAIPQLYGEIAMNDFSVIIGHFYTLVGYEVVQAPNNFFYSHSLTMFNSEPFTHTGVLTTYKGFEGMTLYGGWTLGWDTGFTNAQSGNSLIGGFAVDLLDAVTLTYINTYGNFGTRNDGDRNGYSHSVVLTADLTDSLKYVAQSDYVNADDVVGPPFVENDQIGLNQYLFYEWNDIISLGTRMEWWKNGSVSNYEATTGVNFRVLNNVVIRPEYRKDWVPATDLDEDTFGCDMILTY